MSPMWCQICGQFEFGFSHRKFGDATLLASIICRVIGCIFYVLFSILRIIDCLIIVYNLPPTKTKYPELRQ